MYLPRFDARASDVDEFRFLLVLMRDLISPTASSCSFHDSLLLIFLLFFTSQVVFFVSYSKSTFRVNILSSSVVSTPDLLDGILKKPTTVAARTKDLSVKERQSLATAMGGVAIRQQGSQTFNEKNKKMQRRQGARKK